MRGVGMNILQMIEKGSIKMVPFRSGGLINKDNDMGRVCIDLPIIEAKKLALYLRLNQEEQKNETLHNISSRQDP